MTTLLLEYYDNLNPILEDDKRNEVIQQYNMWVAHEPSIIDGDYNVSRPHHVRTASNSGMGIKPNDLWQIPITYRQHIEHHTKGKFQQVFLDKIEQLHDKFISETKLLHLRTWCACEKSYRRKR